MFIDREELDAWRCERLIDEGRAALADGDTTLAADRLRAALALWRGPAYAELATETYLQTEAARLEELCLVALEERTQADLALGHHAELCGELEALVAEHPYRELLWGQWMLALYRAGRQSDALRAYQRVRSLLGEELGIEPGAALRDLERGILLQRSELDWKAQPVRLSDSVDANLELHPALDRVANNLPLQASSFIGRGEEVVEVRDALDAHRLVTLVGPGGIGKTRVAVQAVADVSGGWAHGVWFVDLTSVVEDEGVGLAVLTTMGYGKRPAMGIRDSVIDVLRRREVLVVLDNCEHVISGAGSLVSALLRSCPGVRVLATSREALGDTAEHVLRLPPFAEAVELFIERTVEEGGLIDIDDLSTVAAICARLDYLPLAIELAASRCAALSPVEVLDRLDDALPLLVARRHDRDRHDTMRQTIGWSYELLDEHDQDAFDRLSVFSGGFTLGGADAMLGCDALEPVASLAAKSMLVAERQVDGTTRYRMLETLRQFGANRRVRRGIDEDAMEHLADLAGDFCTRARAGLESADEARWMARIDTELSNLRSVIAWALEHGEGQRALAVIGNLYFYAFHRPSPEFVDWAERALDLPGATTDPLVIDAHFVAFFGCWRVPDFAAGLQHADAIDTIVDALGLPTPYWSELIARERRSLHRRTGRRAQRRRSPEHAGLLEGARMLARLGARVPPNGEPAGLGPEVAGPRPTRSPRVGQPINAGAALLDRGVPQRRPRPQ